MSLTLAASTPAQTCTIRELTRAETWIAATGTPRARPHSTRWPKSLLPRATTSPARPCTGAQGKMRDARRGGGNATHSGVRDCGGQRHGGQPRPTFRRQVAVVLPCGCARVGADTDRLSPLGRLSAGPRHLPQRPAYLHACLHRSAFGTVANSEFIGDCGGTLFGVFDR